MLCLGERHMGDHGHVRRIYIHEYCVAVATRLLFGTMTLCNGKDFRQGF